MIAFRERELENIILRERKKETDRQTETEKQRGGRQITDFKRTVNQTEREAPCAIVCQKFDQYRQQNPCVEGTMWVSHVHAV